MIESIRFKNFKILRDAELPLGRFTLIVGPNGSGKSTALQALQTVYQKTQGFSDMVTVSLQSAKEASVEITLRWGAPHSGMVTTESYSSTNARNFRNVDSQGKKVAGGALEAELASIRVYSLDAPAIAAKVGLDPEMELSPNGSKLAGVLDQLRDRDPERFEALNKELGRWLPEFDRILFETPNAGQRAFLLRTRKGRHAISAIDLSQGTVLALAILTLAYLPDPPSIVGIEEPDRGVHPRLLRKIQDALYRLSCPENFGEKREPVQVIATTHSPYFLDLYKDHPEEIVIAQKTADGARFERLSEQPHLREVLGDAPLGEVWHSGVLGGVPVE